jgi:hypothetical protein
VWSTLSAASNYDYAGFWIVLDAQGYSSGGSYWGLVDIAIGPTGSEQIILPNIAIQSNVALASAFYPIPIPAGQRIAARVAMGAANLNYRAGVTLYGLRA